MAYTTTTGWTAGTTNDFFAFKGDGQLLLDSSFGTIQGALRKYDMEKAIHMSIPVATINGLTVTSDSINIPFSTFATLTATNVLDLGQIQYAYSDFVKECADYFGLTIESWNSTSDNGLKMLFDTGIVTKVIGNTNSSATADAGKRLMTAAGFINIIANTSAATTALANNKLTVSELTKNFNNAKQTNAFGNGADTNRLTGFLADDLLFFANGVSLTFTVNLIDTALTSGSTGASGGPDYINTNTNLNTSTNSTVFTTQTSTNNGYFTTTTALASSVLTKTYVVPLVLKVV